LPFLERIAVFSNKQQIAQGRSFFKERRSALLYVAKEEKSNFFCKRAKEQIALRCSFCKEQKCELIYVVLFTKRKRVNRSFCSIYQSAMSELLSVALFW